MILVAGGTGRLGSRLVRRLLDTGEPVRVLTREPSRAARLGQDVEVVRGDVRRPGDVARAVAGARCVVSAVHGFDGPGRVSPTTVDRDGNANLTAAARSVGADVVLVSVAPAAPDSDMELFRMKYAAEQRLRGSGVDWTVVRSAAFLELWVEMLQHTARRSGRPLVLGVGRNPISFVGVEDVAALLEHAVLEPRFRGGVLEIGGPEDLTMSELAGAVQLAAGRTAAPRHLPPALLAAMAGTVGRISPSLGRRARAALAMDRDPMTVESRALRRRLPDLPATTASRLLGLAAGSAIGTAEADRRCGPTAGREPAGPPAGG
jgi:uncharacterized protein YbjT (DUF2867 family)